MHFIDVGFRSSCSSSTDYYYSKTDLYGLTENDEEINIISWIDVNDSHFEKYNMDVNSNELDEICKLLFKKKNNLYSVLDFSFVNKDSEKIKRKGSYAKN